MEQAKQSRRSDTEKDLDRWLHILRDVFTTAQRFTFVLQQFLVSLLAKKLGYGQCLAWSCKYGNVGRREVDRRSTGSFEEWKTFRMEG